VELTAREARFFFPLLACDLSDHGEIMYSPFPVCCPRSGGTLQAPLCPPPRPTYPKRCDSHQGDQKRTEKNHRPAPTPFLRTP